jgi:hypothetical protein
MKSITRTTLLLAATTALAGWDLAWRDRFPLRWQALLLRELAAQAGVPARALESRMKLVIEGKTALLFS